jgi:hypothetical protein
MREPKDEALSRHSGKGRVHAGGGAGVVDSPFIIDRGVFGSEFETNFTADQHCSLCGPPALGTREARDHTVESIASL